MVALLPEQKVQTTHCGINFSDNIPDQDFQLRTQAQTPLDNWLIFSPKCNTRACENKAVSTVKSDQVFKAESAGILARIVRHKVVEFKQGF